MKYFYRVDAMHMDVIEFASDFPPRVTKFAPSRLQENP